MSLNVSRGCEFKRESRLVRKLFESKLRDLNLVDADGLKSEAFFKFLNKKKPVNSDDGHLIITVNPDDGHVITTVNSDDGHMITTGNSDDGHVIIIVNSDDGHLMVLLEAYGAKNHVKMVLLAFTFIITIFLNKYFEIILYHFLCIKGLTNFEFVAAVCPAFS